MQLQSVLDDVSLVRVFRIAESNVRDQNSKHKK
jgi:hypothetical protein